MEKINFNATINATKEKVWTSLWEKENYKTWTSVFAEGSTVETDNWKEGSKILFTDGKGSGMVSKVAANRPNEFMSFEHLGMMKDGIEDTTSDAVKDWAGAIESYTLKQTDDKTELKVEMDINDEYKDYFLKTWPQAMEKIKELAEK